MIMDKQAANIAFQLFEAAKGNLAPDEMTLDMHTEQAMMCTIHGIVECTNPKLVQRFLLNVNQLSGCTELKPKNAGDDGRVIEKRADQFIGKNKFMNQFNFPFLFTMNVYQG